MTTETNELHTAIYTTQTLLKQAADVIEQHMKSLAEAHTRNGIIDDTEVQASIESDADLIAELRAAALQWDRRHKSTERPPRRAHQFPAEQVAAVRADLQGALQAHGIDTQSSDITQKFEGLPLRKLKTLLSDGWAINGVSIERTEEDGTARRGAVTTGGMVLWWHETEGQAPVQEPMERAKQIWREDQRRIAELSAEIDRLTTPQPAPTVQEPTDIWFDKCFRSDPPAQPAARTDQQIVDQTEELAVWLLSWCFNHQPETDTPMRESTHPFAERCWAAACHIQEMLTATDPENAVAELDVDDTPPEQPAPVQPVDIAALVEGMEVSIDVSTGDHDSGNRLFGSVTLVQENQGSKHGLILLVQDPEANFKTATIPASWMEMVTANLVREGVNKHKARELAEHFYSLAPAAQPAPCTWTKLGDHLTPDTYSATCGAMWTFTDGGPTDNNMNFCPKCGSKVVEGSTA